MADSKHHKPKHHASTHHTKKSRQINKWKIISMVLIVILAIVILFYGLGFGMPTSDPQVVADKTIAFINDNLVQPGTTASFVSVEESAGLYNITLLYQERNIPVYATKNGNYIFLAEPLDITKDLPQPEEPAPPAAVEVSADDDASKGSADAPVLIIEFSDFECPFCARFYSETLPQIQSEYIDTGLVRFVYRDFPLGFHDNAQKAAEAAECAEDQGMFWEMHDILYENQGALDVASLKQHAIDLGLDSAEFDDCLDSDKYAAEVQSDLADGQSYGVTGTPAFFVNGILISGAQPFSAFQQVIEAELA